MAPYYLALPRPQPLARPGRQSSGRNSYVRSAPSSIFTVVTGVAVALPYVLLGAVLAFLCPLAAAVIHNKRSVFTILQDSIVGCEVPVPETLVFALAHPQVTIGFKATIPDVLVALLDSWGGTWRVIPKKGRVCVVDINQARIGELMAYESEINFDLQPMGGTMRLQDHVQFNLLLKTITTVTSALQLAYASDDQVAVSTADSPDIWSVLPETTEERPDAKDKTKKITYKIPEKIGFDTRRYFGTNVVVRDADYWDFGSQMIDARSGPQFFRGTSTSLRLVMNSVGAGCRDNVTWDRSNPPLNLSWGLYLPYEPNYTLPDRQGLTSFANDFSGFFTNESGDLQLIPDLQDSWVEAVHRTPVGEQLGHIMAVLSLAKRVHGGVKVVITNGIYEGAVIHAAQHFVLSQRGLNVEAVDREALLEDIAKFNTHSRILSEFITHFALAPTTATNITSMRQLRQLILASRTGVLTPADRTFIDANALYLNFPQRPVTFTTESLGLLLSYLDESAPAAVPITTFMPYQGLSFADNESAKLALSMFGMLAPSPLGFGTEFMLVQRGAMAKEASAAPNVLRFAKKPLQACVTDWCGCGRNSIMMFDPRTKGKKMFQLKGDQAASGWAMMTAWATQQYTHNRIEAGAIIAGSRKRDREDEGAGGDGQAARPTKRSKFGAGPSRAAFF
jgi:hypothetical protein